MDPPARGVTAPRAGRAPSTPRALCLVMSTRAVPARAEPSPSLPGLRLRRCPVQLPRRMLPAQRSRYSPTRWPLPNTPKPNLACFWRFDAFLRVRAYRHPSGQRRTDGAGGDPSGTIVGIRSGTPTDGPQEIPQEITVRNARNDGRFHPSPDFLNSCGAKPHPPQ
jgi:hypothetical protein